MHRYRTKEAQHRETHGSLPRTWNTKTRDWKIPLGIDLAGRSAEDIRAPAYVPTAQLKAASRPSSLQPLGRAWSAQPLSSYSLEEIRPPGQPGHSALTLPQRYPVSAFRTPPLVYKSPNEFSQGRTSENQIHVSQCHPAFLVLGPKR